MSKIFIKAGLIQLVSLSLGFLGYQALEAINWKEWRVQEGTLEQ